MSTSDQLAAVVGTNKQSHAPAAAKKQRPALVRILLSPGFKNQLATALPKHLTADRMARIALTEVRKNPALLKTQPESFMGSVMQAAQLGIEIGSALGQAYLVPYGDQCTFILGYRGMIDLARRSGQVLSLNAYVVREGDDFSYQLGLHPDIHHIPSPEANRIKQPITFVYAVANLQGGGYQFEVMSAAEILSVRNSSASYKKQKEKSIWGQYYEEMAKKTVIRRLFKYLPVSIEAIQATTLDAKREAGEEIKPEDVIDINNVTEADFTEIPDEESVQKEIESNPPTAEADGNLI